MRHTAATEWIGPFHISTRFLGVLGENQLAGEKNNSRCSTQRWSCEHRRNAPVRIIAEEPKWHHDQSTAGATSLLFRAKKLGSKEGQGTDHRGGQGTAGSAGRGASEVPSIW